MSTIKLKELLLENPDTLILRLPNGEDRYIGYGGSTNAVTGIIFDDPKAGTQYNYVALVDDPEAGERAVAEYHNEELNKKAVEFLSNPQKFEYGKDRWMEKHILSEFVEDEMKGHGSLESFIEYLTVHLYDTEKIEVYGKYLVRGRFEEVYRFRIFNVKGKRYFTIWKSSLELFNHHLDLFVKIVKDCGMDPNTMMWEVAHVPEADNYGRVKIFTFKELSERLHRPAAPENNAPESEIKKRIKELSKKFSEMEADEHVKGATWSESDRKRHKIEMTNIKAELDALFLADKSGETDIKKVVIKTIDTLADDDEIVPADVLYAELEKKLNRYGTSAIAIIRALRDKGVDIKKALREINEKFGGKASATELLSELSKYTQEPKNMNENDQSPALVQPSTIERFRETVNSPEAFLAIFKGHKLSELLEKLSYCRIYVMNKFDDFRGEDPQQRFVWMLDHAISYINYRLISPHRKFVDDQDEEDRKRPEVIAHAKKKSEILKQSFAAARAGDHDRAVKLRQSLLGMDDPPTRYAANMKNMEKKVAEIHNTPLSKDEVTPSPDDSDADKKRFDAFVRAFNEFKKSN
jgi:hypothetical protein